MPIPEAKTVIEHSAAWSDRYEHDAHFREAAVQALHDLAASNDRSLPKLKFSHRVWMLRAKHFD
jgi:hypothetical protein